MAECDVYLRQAALNTALARSKPETSLDEIMAEARRFHSFLAAGCAESKATPQQSTGENISEVKPRTNGTMTPDPSQLPPNQPA